MPFTKKWLFIVLAAILTSLVYSAWIGSFRLPLSKVLSESELYLQVGLLLGFLLCVVSLLGDLYHETFATSHAKEYLGVLAGFTVSSWVLAMVGWFFWQPVLYLLP